MMFNRSRRLALPILPLVLLVGCESPWYQAEPIADAMIPPTNPWSCDMSRQQLADTVGKPGDVNFFGDQAEYMGDKDGYRYVHVRGMSEFWGFLGECVYRVPESEWPMVNPMPLTQDVTQWQDVTWMNGDGPAGVPQNVFQHITPVFPLGAPKTQPAPVPPTIDFSTQPATGASPAATQAEPAQTAPTLPATGQETRPAATGAAGTQPLSK